MVEISTATFIRAGYLYVMYWLLSPLPHPQYVGSANNAFPLYSGRFSLTCPRTVLTRLHVYGLSLIHI